MNGKPCRLRTLGKAGARIELELAERISRPVQPDDDVSVTVLHEDEDLIVVDKPAGQRFKPGPRERSGTLYHGVLAYLGEAAAPGQPRLFVLHAVRGAQSGVVALARSEVVRARLRRMFLDLAVEREVTAVTVGCPSLGEIRSRVAPDPKGKHRLTSAAWRGREVVTVVETVEPLLDGLAALVSCRVRAASRNPIRVHLAERAGCPVLRDRRYSPGRVDERLRPVARDLGRPAMHLSALALPHPRHGRPMRFESPLPQDLVDLIDRLRSGQPGEADSSS